MPVLAATVVALHWAVRYRPYYWEDISSPFPDIGEAALTRLTFQKKFVFADGTAAAVRPPSQHAILGVLREPAQPNFEFPVRAGLLPPKALLHRT